MTKTWATRSSHPQLAPTPSNAIATLGWISSYVAMKNYGGATLCLN